MKKIIMLATLALLLLAPAVMGAFAQSADAPEALKAEVVPCPMSVPGGETEGETIICGQIEVPQDWDEPEGTSIVISYAVLRARNLAPFSDPVLYFEGGPGGSALNNAQNFSSFDRLRDTRDVILWDQRGTTFSGDLFCPAEVQVVDADKYQEQESAYQEQVANFDGRSDPDEVYATVAGAVSGADPGLCLPYFEEQGIDVSQYSTENTVLDTLALMRHLDYPAYNLYGISYGTTVVLSIADYYANNPDADLPPVRSGVIDGVFPMNLDMHEWGYMAAYNMLRVFSECEEDAACGAAYPNIRQRTVDLLASLEEDPLEREDGSQLTVDDLVEVLRTAVSGQHALIPYLPRIVAEVENGVTDAFDVAQAAARYQVTLPPVGFQAKGADDSSSGTGMGGIISQLQDIESQLGMFGVADDIIAKAAVEADSRPALYIAILDGFLDLSALARSNMAQTLQPFLLHPEQRTGEGLVSIAGTVLLPQLASELTSLAGSLSEEEIAEVYDGLLRNDFLRGLIGVEFLTNNVVDCNDRASTMSYEEAFDIYREYEAPQLLDHGVSTVVYMQYQCERLGLAAPAYAAPPDGVVSDWRMLVVNGAVDGATPVEWGEYAFEPLTNAEMITLPYSPHAASTASQCGKDIVNSFVLSPDTELNLSCIEAARPVYVLPDDELPALPTVPTDEG